MPLRPGRGGFFRPFGTAIFIRDFLAGLGPFGSPVIDPAVGACQEDIFYHYKKALHRALAEDAVAWEKEQRIRKKLPPLTEEEEGDLLTYYLERIPRKLTRCRYHSFVTYFGMLRRLGWVEFTGKEEPSAIQDAYPEGQPRRLYRLTPKGKRAPSYQWSNPLITLYGYDRSELNRKKRQARRKYFTPKKKAKA